MVPYPEIRRVDPEEVKSRLDAGDDDVIIDVRSPASYAARHIAGALSIPLDVLQTGSHALPRDKDLILY